MCMAGPQFPKLSLTEHHISCELRIELYFVFIGSFSTMKNNKLPSAEIVGLSSGKSVLIFAPKFSTLITVDGFMMFSFCATSFPEVSNGCAFARRILKRKRRSKVSFFKGQDLRRKIIENCQNQ